MNVIQRIETLIGSECLSTNAFARKIGADPANLGKMLAGKQNITDKTLRKISDAYGLNLKWLKYGEGEMVSVPPAENPTTINSNISDGGKINRLLSMLEERDRQIDKLLQIISNLNMRVMKLNEQITV